MQFTDTASAVTVALLPLLQMAARSPSATSTAAAMPVAPLALATLSARLASMAAPWPTAPGWASPPMAAPRSRTPRAATTTWPSSARAHRVHPVVHKRRHSGRAESALPECFLWRRTGSAMTSSPSEITTQNGSLDSQAVQALLETVQREIAACALCVEAGFIPLSRPVFQGHVGQRLMIVGQAPGPSSGRRGVPYTGATGRTLQRWLERAGFPPGTLHRDFYLTSLTKCFPGPATGRGGKGDRPPSAREIALCARHLDREIALVRPEIVVSLGRLAAERLDPTARGLPPDRSGGEPPSG